MSAAEQTGATAAAGAEEVGARGAQGARAVGSRLGKLRLETLGKAVGHVDVAWKKVVAASLRVMSGLAPALAITACAAASMQHPFDSLRFHFQKPSCATSFRSLLVLRKLPRRRGVRARQA